MKYKFITADINLLLDLQIYFWFVIADAKLLSQIQIYFLT
jgi:hypothetical protein